MFLSPQFLFSPSGDKCRNTEVKTSMPSFCNRWDPEQMEYFYQGPGQDSLFTVGVCSSRSLLMCFRFPWRQFICYEWDCRNPSLWGGMWEHACRPVVSVWKLPLYHAGAACPSPYFDCCLWFPEDLSISSLQSHSKVCYLMVLDDQLISLISPSGAEKKLLGKRSWQLQVKFPLETKH